ncbi:hypothetical protein PEPS_39750 (plasmid) [Persicobacter psychrovividus]|uniref:ParB/Sulfiredoxin domain-containing protein n=2 Tax=Persicobacter psychrovividus TaxID=387638 RepID=A0ABM7VL11_9BACT|nr:hypothetical protein PEPS_39750 [Persicobacter psychrovividus]
MAKKFQMAKEKNVAKKATSNFLGDSKEVIKSNIIINDELKQMIPALQKEEYEQLEANILEEGLREPILIWKTDGQYVLVDGHNRYSITQKHQLHFDFKLLEFKNMEAAKDWMINNQLGRRNLTDEQRAYFIGLRYQREKGTQGGQKRTGDQHQVATSVKTEVRLAEEYKTSPKSVRNNADYATGVDLIGKTDPALKESILSGDTKIRKSDVQGLAKLTETEVKEQAETIQQLISKHKPLKKPSVKKTLTPTDIKKKEINKVLRRIDSNSTPEDFHQLRNLIDQLQEITNSPT